jgi:hypothetical protein
MSPSGIETTTFRLVQQCLNQLRVFQKECSPDAQFRGFLAYHVRVPDETELAVSFILATLKTITAGLLESQAF